MRLGGTTVRRASAIIGIVFASLTAIALPASAAGSYSHTFDLKHPSFSVTDRNGTFDAQMKFVATATTLNPMNWSFVIAPTLRAIAAGTTTCVASQTQNGVPTSYHDKHANEPVGFVWHSTVPKNPYAYNEILAGTCTFPVKGNGRAVLTITFHYIASDGGGNAVAAATGAGSLNTSLSISH